MNKDRALVELINLVERCKLPGYQKYNPLWLNGYTECLAHIYNRIQELQEENKLNAGLSTPQVGNSKLEPVADKEDK